MKVHSRRKLAGYDYIDSFYFIEVEAQNDQNVAEIPSSQGVLAGRILRDGESTPGIRKQGLGIKI